MIDYAERKKQLIAEGALHRAVLCAEREVLAQTLHPGAVGRGLLQRAASLGGVLLRRKQGGSVLPEALAVLPGLAASLVAARNPPREAAEHAAPSAQAASPHSAADAAPPSWSMLLSSLLPTLLPVVLRALPSLTRTGGALTRQVSRKTLLRSAAAATATAALVLWMRRRSTAHDA